jgi:DNA polymerase type B, organellar and viral
MFKTLFLFFIAAVALSSMVILITFRLMDNMMLLTSLIFNIVWLTTIFYIQPIGWGIKIYTLLLLFILINNIFLSFTRLIYINLSIKNRFKDFIGKFLGFYMKFFYVYPNFLLKKFLSLLSVLNKYSDIFNNRVNNIIYDLLVIEPLKLISKEFDENSKHTLLTFSNNKLLDHKNLFVALFAGLALQDEFKKEGKKIMIVSISKEDRTFNIHKNIIIDENTTVNNYLEKILSSIQAFYESGYPITTFEILQVKLWDYQPQSLVRGKKGTTSNTVYQSRRSFHSSCLINKNTNLNLIKPLKIPKNINKLLIATIDLETIELNNNQVPISISFSYYLNEELLTIFELIDYKLLLLDQDQAVKLLWLKFMNRLNDLNLHKCIIFTHNLGSFDGYFIFKGLLGLPGVNIDKVNSIIDELHRFIGIDIIWKDTKLIFKDSLRIFPVSLQELCKVFEVEGKLFKYNPEFNKISLFENKELLEQFIAYSKQDSICLLKALTKAQDIYIKEHKVDFASVWSTSTLSFKIFRQNFLKIDITTLTNKLDSILRLAYIGGSTDYYLKYGENLKHYDVNSLYPKAMCNLMPIEFLGESEGTNVRLEDIFGFAEARITTPDNMEIPLLPFKIFNETLHPLGSWIGIYFTEELKAVEKYGYKIELIKVYHFSKADIFSSYINYFYNIKKLATGALRLIAKMHLNQLYGYFGRRKTLIETKNVYKSDLTRYYGSHTIFSEINVNENISTILMSSNLDYGLINEIKSETELDLITNFRKIKSHVGIAAAVTAYARIEMIELKMILIKLGIKLYYTDTDSFFVDAELPSYLVGSELGQLKDELKGGWIKKAYFLGIKKYGYLDDKDITHSIFTGVERDSLTWKEIGDISRGISITKPSPNRFYKNINNLNIIIKESLQTSINFNTRKTLFNNRYLPIRINIKILIKIDYYLRIVKNKILNLINKSKIEI